MNPGLQTAGSKSQQLSITFWVLYTRICSRKFGDRSCSRRWGGVRPHAVVVCVQGCGTCSQTCINCLSSTGLATEWTLYIYS